MSAEGRRLPGLFITGTDTGVGKTWVASAIARILSGQGHRVGVLKPVATGATRSNTGWHSEDAEILKAAVGGDVPDSRVAPLVFEEPLAPPVAARRQGGQLGWAEVIAATHEALAWWADRAEVMVVEGIGGLLCPIAEGATVADLAIALDYPLVIVARRGLGTINQTLLTVEAARWRALRIAGVVLNASDATTDPIAEATNAAELARRLGGVGLLAETARHGAPLDLGMDLGVVDWYGWARPHRGAGSDRAAGR
jgi:dethiobiotin synthetase